MNRFLSIQLPIILYSLLGLGCIFQGVRYLGAGELMPYHLDVLGATWDMLSAESQQLYLGLLKGFGAGSLVVGLTVLVLICRPKYYRLPLTRAATALVGVGYTTATVYVTHAALLPNAVPRTVSIIMLGIAVFAAACSLVTFTPEDHGEPE